MIKKWIVACVIPLALWAQHSAEVNLNNDDMELQATVDLSAIYGLQGGSYLLGAGYLAVLDDNDNTSTMLDLDFKLYNPVQGIEGLYGALGAKAVYSEYGQDDFMAFPLQAMIEIRPRGFAVPVALGATVAYAPRPLSFQEADSYSEMRLEGRAEIIQQGFLYVGYRQIVTDYKTLDVTLNNSVYVGCRIYY